MAIKEVIEDVKDSMGENGFIWLIGGFAVIFIISLLSKSGGEEQEPEEYQIATSYSSYPDAVTNANVIIDTIQEDIKYSEDELKEYVTDTYSGLTDDINTKFEYTNNYMKEGLEKQQELSNKIYDDTMGSINNSFTTLNTKIDTNQTQITSQVADIKKTAEETKKTVTSTNKVATSTNKTVNDIKKTVSKPTTTKSTTNTKVSTAKTSTNTIKKTSYKGNSIVDGLKSVGVNSSYSYRSQLAKANGIKNYTGTASQNTQLLNKLKSGTLKKA